MRSVTITEDADGKVLETITEVTADEAKNSIEVCRNAAGGYSFSVKRYGDNMEVIHRQVADEAAILEATYPVQKKG